MDKSNLKRKLIRLSVRMLGLLKVRNVAFDILILSDARMRDLKARFFRKKTEPNVLAFPEPAGFPHPETKKRYLGEVYLNRDILRKNPVRAEHLLLHGILHLLGHDHKKIRDAAKMESLEAKILSKLARAK